MSGNLTARQIEVLPGGRLFVSRSRFRDPRRASHWRDELEELERSHGKFHYLPKAHLVLPLADRLARDPAVLDAVESLLGPDILLWDSTFIIKEPGDGKKVSWHQDLTYWGLRSTRCRVSLAGAVVGVRPEWLHANDFRHARRASYGSSGKSRCGQYSLARPDES